MDGMTVTSEDFAQAVRESALLADITLSVWSATVRDYGAMEELKYKHGAKGNVGSVIKNLFAGADGPLKDAQSAYNKIRTIHYGLTLPWVANPHAPRQEGARLLTHLLFETYVKALSSQIRAAQASLDKLVGELPAMEAAARANLGGMAPAKYPSADDVRGKVRVAYDFEPIPSAAAFQGLDDFTLERLSKRMQTKHEQCVLTAQAAMWGQVRDKVSHLASSLADPEYRFHESTLENVRDLLVTMPGWNLTRDDRVDEVVADLKRLLDGIDAKTLRKDAGTRKGVSAEAQQIVDKLAGWGL